MKKKKKIRATAPTVEALKSAETAESTAPKKKRRSTRRILFNAMFVMSIIFIMISLTFSWFSLSDTSHVDGAQLGISDANNLEVGGQFSLGKIDSVAGDGVSFFEPVLENKLVATNGNYNIYQKVNSGKYNALTDDVVSEKADADSLFVKDVTLTIRGKHNIYMVDGTGIVPEGEGAEFLEGAMRVSVMKFNEESKKYELCLIWIPDVTSQKSGDDLLDSKVTYVYSDEEGTKESSFEITSEHGEKILDNGVRYVWGKIDGKPENNVLIGELEGTGKYRFVIWLDGNDRECDYELLDRDIVATFKLYPEQIGGAESE